MYRLYVQCICQNMNHSFVGKSHIRCPCHCGKIAVEPFFTSCILCYPSSSSRLCPIDYGTGRDGILFAFAWILKVNAVLQGRRHRDPPAGGKHVISGSLVDVVKEVGAGEKGGIKEGNHKGSPSDALESEKDLVPGLLWCVYVCVQEQYCSRSRVRQQPKMRKLPLWFFQGVQCMSQTTTNLRNQLLLTFPRARWVV